MLPIKKFYKNNSPWKRLNAGKSLKRNCCCVNKWKNIIACHLVSECFISKFFPKREIIFLIPNFFPNQRLIIYYNFVIILIKLMSLLSNYWFTCNASYRQMQVIDKCNSLISASYQQMEVIKKCNSSTNATH